MKGLSLRVRSIMLAILALAVFIPVTVLTLDKAYTTSLTQAKLSELKLMNLALVSAFELDGAIPSMPDLLYEEQLNLPDSGYVGLIIFRNNVVWQSASALHYSIEKPPPPPAVGDDYFLEFFHAPFDESRAYFAYAFTAEFAAESDFEPVHFYIFNDKTEFNTERDAFLSAVWRWMLLLAVSLLALLIIGTNVVLAPVRVLIKEIRHTANGEQKQLTHNYPVEFNGLKTSINQLLHAEAEQRSRYKNSLGDLAHSLKTPLAVALGANSLPEEAKDALFQINQLVQRQLKRATAGNTGWQPPIAVLPSVEKLKSAMQKVYRHKHLQITIEQRVPVLFKGDETDLMEILGNVMDNASKAARQRIHVSLFRQGRWAGFAVEDDGPGIPQHQKTLLLKRGERLDTYTEGQGIGLAVVSDLVSIYEGRLTIQDSPLGGAKIVIQFPFQEH
ncbi:GHKL domain-containing protein [Alteromonas pelagimontana]|uniref:histidine kinase n=1 Tax=Alteromonas pelagimontana TaxID=1858656 RepID=A0A6M4M9Y0_9ALTE|nr:ATP-binding protein [Alteromonas pelagimontana]QJR79769.1 GHKL domain-containing protein [Alteromonas pelagimontana]